MKECSRCKKLLDTDCFYGDCKARDGLQSACIQCKKDAVGEWRIAKPRAYEKVQKRYYRRHKESVKKRIKAWHENNPEKHKAELLAAQAIKSGKLVRQPCEVCGAIKVDAHHDDYAYPFAVRWLCRRHHKQLHVALGTEK